jgi:hypothetical protein
VPLVPRLVQSRNIPGALFFSLSPPYCLFHPPSPETYQVALSSQAREERDRQLVSKLTNLCCHTDLERCQKSQSQDCQMGGTKAQRIWKQQWQVVDAAYTYRWDGVDDKGHKWVHPPSPEETEKDRLTRARSSPRDDPHETRRSQLAPPQASRPHRRRTCPSLDSTPSSAKN